MVYGPLALLHLPHFLALEEKESELIKTKSHKVAKSCLKRITINFDKKIFALRESLGNLK